MVLQPYQVDIRLRYHVGGDQLRIEVPNSHDVVLDAGSVLERVLDYLEQSHFKLASVPLVRSLDLTNQVLDLAENGFG